MRWFSKTPYALLKEYYFIFHYLYWKILEHHCLVDLVSDLYGKMGIISPLSSKLVGYGVRASQLLVLVCPDGYCEWRLSGRHDSLPPGYSLSSYPSLQKHHFAQNSNMSNSKYSFLKTPLYPGLILHFLTCWIYSIITSEWSPQLCAWL